MRGKRKRIERWMVVKVAPRLRLEKLNGSIQRGSGGNQECQDRWVKGVNVAEMHNHGVAPEQCQQAISGPDHHCQGHEKQQMDIRESVDELRNVIVWLHSGEHRPLPNPALRYLVARYFHPNRVYRVTRHGHEICHNHIVTTINRHRVKRQLIGSLAHKPQGVGLDNEVVILRIVMGCRERYRVYLPFGKVPSVRCGAGLVVT